MNNQITTVTFFKFETFNHKLWAFAMMRLAHPALKKAVGQQFYKLMGSGNGNGFSPFPDWSVYSLLQVWDDEEAAQKFFAESDFMMLYTLHSKERFTLYLHCISAHGLWSGINPFIKSDHLDADNLRVAAITRATIKNKFLLRFWKYVPTSQKPIENAAGLIYKKGIGEIPIKQMSTFSLWTTLENLKDFAYRSPEHQKAISMTRELSWYSEELFARFQPYKMTGSWEGKTDWL